MVLLSFEGCALTEKKGITFHLVFLDLITKQAVDLD